MSYKQYNPCPCNIETVLSPAVRDGGSPLGCQFMLELASEAVEPHTLLVLGAVIGAVAGLGTSLGDMCMCVGLTVGMCVVGTGALTSSTQLNSSVLSSLLFCEASASRITNTAHKFVIVFQIPLGNGPNQFSFHSNTICRSLALHCMTMLSDIACCLCK
jgi:hypothetical protein